MNKSRAWAAALLVLIVTFLSFYPSLENGFTNWDDDTNVALNPLTGSLSLKNTVKIFTSSYCGLYIPLTYLSFAIERHFFGLSPLSYHLVNLILHLSNCLLVFVLIALLTDSCLVAVIVSLLFGVHPLHVESVAWVSERKDVLYAFFFLAAAVSYLLFMKKRALKYYWAALASFVLSLLSKPAAVAFPFVILLFEYFLVRRKAGEGKTPFPAKLPFFAAAVICVIVALYSGRQIIHHERAFTAGDNFFVASYGLVFYIYKFLVPLKLSCLYPYPAKINGILPPALLFSPLLAAAAIAIAVASLKYTKKIFFGFALFFITILPSLQLVPNTMAAAADRYMYIPLIGLAYIVGEAAAWLYGKIPRHHFIRAGFLAVLAAAVLALALLTQDRCRVWKNGIVLWGDALNKYPRSAAAYNNRGVAYSDQGDFDMALADYRRALEIDPYYTESYNNAGVALLNKKEYANAMVEFSKTVRLDPGYWEAYYNIAMIYGLNAEHAQAAEFFRKAIAAKPDYAMAYAGLGSAYGNLGDFRQAAKNYEKAIELGDASEAVRGSLSAARALLREQQ